jgi:hypothetical protein
VIAGTGLTGGGALTGNVTLNVATSTLGLQNIISFPIPVASTSLTVQTPLSLVGNILSASTTFVGSTYLGVASSSGIWTFTNNGVQTLTGTAPISVSASTGTPTVSITAPTIQGQLLMASGTTWRTGALVAGSNISLTTSTANQITIGTTGLQLNISWPIPVASTSLAVTLPLSLSTNQLSITAPTVQGQLLMASGTTWRTGALVAGTGISLTTSTINQITITNSGVQSLNTSTGTVSLTFSTSTAYTNTSLRLTTSTPTGWTINYPTQWNDLAAIATSTGNLIVASSTGWKGLTVGTTGKILMASSTASLGVSWETAIFAKNSSSTIYSYNAGNSTMTGGNNFMVGNWAGTSTTSGYGNNFIGFRAGASTTTGFYNDFIGYSAGASNTTGTYNVALGYMAGFSNKTGSGDVFIGPYAGYYENGTSSLYIDDRDRGSTTGDRTGALIYGTFANASSSQQLTINGSVYVPIVYSTTSGGGSNGAVYVDSTGLLYRNVSSLRYKFDIKKLSDDFLALLKVKPKSFKYQGSNTSDIGYIAEDFDALGLTNLVSYDNEGRPDSIKYEKIPLYLTEIVKQQQADINKLKLSAGLNKNGSLGNGSIYFEDISTEHLAATTANIETATIKTADIETMQLRDRATGEIYCTWIENGEWQKAKGECRKVYTLPAVVVPSTTPVIAPAAVSTATLAVAPPTSTPETVSTSTPASIPPSETVPAATSTPETITPTPPVDVDQLKQEVKQELKQELKSELKQTISNQVESVIDQVQDQVQLEVQQQLQEQQQNTPNTSVQSTTPAEIQQQSGGAETPPPAAPEQQPAAPAASESLPQAGANLINAFGNFAKWLFISAWEGFVSVTQTIKHSTASLIDNVEIYFKAGSQRIASGFSTLTAVLSDSIQGLTELAKWIFHIK